MNKSEIERALNPEQFAAATAPDGPVLVLAAAGSGKTRTLVYRVAYLVGRDVDPSRILLLTFTNRAAGEMLDRARQLIGDGVSGVWGGTFHHMANRILRRHAAALGFRPDFTIMDRDDSKKLVGACVKEYKLDTKEFPRAEVLLNLFGSAANTERPLAGIVERRFADEAIDPEAVLRVHALYEERKKTACAMDFDDMLIYCLRLFRQHPAILDRYRDQFEHVLVDEYQDTSTIQAEIVDRLASGRRNLLVVGDDFQSIYSWRGADFRNILSFGTRYTDALVFKLETNYRSRPGILAVANACIAGNPEQFQKVLRATRDNSGQRRPVLAGVRDGDTQARYVVEQVRRLRRAGYALRDIAVLYRAHFHAMELERTLPAERIPYQITSGIRFFEQAHIKDVCCILRILENPRDELAFVRLLTLLPGVGDKTALKIWNALGGQLDASDPAQLEQLLHALRPAAQVEWKKIAPILAAYRDESLFEDGGEVIFRFCKAFYEKHAAIAYEDHKDRMDDVSALIDDTTRYENVAEFLSEIALLTNVDAEDDSHDENNDDRLRLSTVHQAKGLEWPVVIVLWTNEGLFPSGRVLKETDDDSEERRLFYVAITRAKDELHFCVPEVRRTKDGGVMPCEPSRFLTEIEPDLIQKVNPGFL